MAIHPPKKDKLFKKHWNILIKSVEKRENFNATHLKQLEILVDLIIDYDSLTEFVRTNGSTYESRTQYGFTYKKYPEVELRQKTIIYIKDYCKLLDVTLAKDVTIKEEPEAEKWQ